MTTNEQVSSLTDRLDELLAPWNRADQPGIAVGVLRGDELLYRRGFGMASLESSVAIGPTTRMRIGSTSKQFTCMLVLLLAEDGKIDLDAPIGTYIDELKGDVARPTIRQLMLHRGGGRDYVDLSFIAHGWNTGPAGMGLQTQARQSNQNFAPGEAMIYNNGGYHLLSIAAERAGGAPFETLLTDRLFAPLEMRETISAPSDHVVLPGMATLHMPTMDGGWRRGLFPSEEVKGEGAIVSTIDDMLRWTRHLRTRDRFGSPESWRSLVTPVEGADVALGAYAFGLHLAEYRGLPTVSHSGGVIGGSCEMMTVPGHELDIVVITNGAPGASPTALSWSVIDLVLDAQLGPAPVLPKAADHATALGNWWSPATGDVYGLVDIEGDLKVEMFGQPYGIGLRTTADGRIVSPEGDIGEVEFGVGAIRPDELDIAFCGRSDTYHRLDKAAVDRDDFGRALAGRFYSVDLNATATFSANDEGLTVEIADGYGSTAGPVTPLGADIAALGPLAMLYWCVISLERTDGVVTGFRLNAMRTRRLTFRRI